MDVVVHRVLRVVTDHLVMGQHVPLLLQLVGKARLRMFLYWFVL